MLMRHYENF